MVASSSWSQVVNSLNSFFLGRPRTAFRPSHREGLPNVILEANAAGVPVVAARATGTVDIVKDGETGLLFPVGDVAGLAKAVKVLLTNKAVATKLAERARERVLREFRQERVWRALSQEYLRLLRMRGLPLAVRCRKGAAESPSETY